MKPDTESENGVGINVGVEYSSGKHPWNRKTIAKVAQKKKRGGSGKNTHSIRLAYPLPKLASNHPSPSSPSLPPLASESKKTPQPYHPCRAAARCSTPLRVQPRRRAQDAGGQEEAEALVPPQFQSFGLGVGLVGLWS